jgi:hypothetical protein
MTTKQTTEKEGRRHNTGLAKVAVHCSADTFVINQTLALCINVCSENRHLNQARNRYPDRNSQRAIIVPEHTFVIPGIAHTPPRSQKTTN